MATFKDKPASTDVLSVSQGDIQGNFEYLQAVLGGSGGTGKDHQILFNPPSSHTSATPGEGRHNSVGFIDNGAQAFPTDGLTGFLYSTLANLYWITSSQGPYQLTNNSTGVVSNSPSNGSTFLPGGMILKWGNFTDSATSGTVSYTTAFPTATFVVLLGYTNTNQTDVVTAKASNNFSWANKASVSATVYWVAIGN